MTVQLLPTLTDEQEMLVEASIRFMDDEVPLSVVRSRADGADRDDTGYLRTAGELGWFGLLADESAGGGSASGNGVLDAALLAAERGARLQPGPFPGHSATVAALSATGGRHAAVLGELVSGGAWATWAFTERPTCELVPAGDEFVLDGRVDVVADLGHCTWALVDALAPGGAAQVLLRTDAPGVGVATVEGLDVSRTWASLVLDSVAVGPDDLVGAPGGETDASVARLGDLVAVLSAAESVGAMDADFQLALAYAKDRVAFGRPIGSFQAVKHLLADTSLWVEMSKGLVADAATALGSGAADGPQLAHAAKAFVAERGVELAHNCFQVFGGIGYTWEHDQHLYLRRLAADAASFGAGGWQRSRLLDAAGVAR